MAEITQDHSAKSITLVVTEFDNNVSLESTNTYDKNCLNGYKLINFNLCDSTNENDWKNYLKKITTDITKITCLTLSRCNLTDLPECISGLVLKNLNLSHNLLKHVPLCILNGLTQLETLNLSNNYIKEFETEPRCVSKLRILNLTNNRMHFLPIWILMLRSINLTELYYSYNQIGSTQESEFKSEVICNLRKLELKNCSVLSDNIGFIKLLPRLTNLNLSNDSHIYKNSIASYEDLCDKPAWKDCIEVLNLNRLIVAFLPENICTFVNLKELYLSETDIFWLPNCLTDFEKLEVLDLSKNSITHLPLGIGEMRSLRVLKVQYNAISSVPDISGLTNLNVLDLYRNELESFVYDIRQFQWIDIEQNLLDTSILGNEYADKKNSFRASNELLDNRLDGCRNDIGVIQESSSYDDDSTSSVCSSDDEIVYQGGGSCEDENWDTWVYKSHPDITTSDEEWQGYHEVKPNKKVVKSTTKTNFDVFFADADE